MNSHFPESNSNFCNGSLCANSSCSVRGLTAVTYGLRYPLAKPNPLGFSTYCANQTPSVGYLKPDRRGLHVLHTPKPPSCVKKYNLYPNNNIFWHTSFYQCKSCIVIIFQWIKSQMSSFISFWCFFWLCYYFVMNYDWNFNKNDTIVSTIRCNEKEEKNIQLISINFSNIAVNLNFFK